MKNISIFLACVIGVFIFEGFTKKIQTSTSQYSLVVKPQSYYVMSGDSFVADIYLTKKIPEPADMLIMGSAGNGENIIHQDGKIHYAAVPFAQGLQTFSGLLSFKNENGVAESLPFRSDFIMTKPVATIMSKYLVKGIENSLNIAVAGIPPMDLQVESTDGAIVSGKVPGIFSLTPINSGKCTITVKSKSKIISNYDFEVIEKK